MKPARRLISSLGMSFQYRRDYRMSRVINFSLRTFVALLLILGQILNLADVSHAGQAQSQAVPLAVLDFQNETRINVRPDLLQKIAQELRQRFVSDYKDILPRPISAGGDSSIKTITIDQLTTLGKQYGVKFMVRGGLLALTREGDGVGTIFRSQIYADIISVESASINTIRAEGVGTQDGAPASASQKGTVFGDSAMERALSSAIEQLASAIHQAITLAPTAGEYAVDSSRTDQRVAQADSVEILRADEGEANEELQQLIAQADELISSGTVSAESLKSISQPLETLRTALALKARLVEQGKDTSEADLEISTKREELKAAISVITEGLSSAETPAVEGQSMSAERRSLLTKINDYLGDTLNIIQKIQEIRAAFRDANREATYVETPTSAGGDVPLPAEEETEEIGGLVTESGAPVEGAVVTEPESGVTATTDGSGSYTLRGIPAGRLVNLIIQKGGKKVAVGKVDLPHGRPAVADFDLKGKSSIQAGLKIIPSTVLLSSAMKLGQTGTLKGTVRDAAGRPVARALVTLNGLAAARTDSQGHYAFLNVPAGAHQLVVQRSGLKLKSEIAIVTAKNTSESRLVFAYGDKISKPLNKQRLTLKGTGAVLRGAILDESRRGVPGAKITLMYSGTAASLITGARGNYEFRDLKPGSYRAWISKVGFEANAQTIPVQQGMVETRDFFLKKKPSDFIAKLPKPVQAGYGARPGLTTKPEMNIGRPVAIGGQLIGRIIDAQNRRPIANAAVSIEGRRTVVTDQGGKYAITDLAPGIYRIRVKAGGYSIQEATIKIVAGDSARQDFFLRPEMPGMKPAFEIRRVR